MQLAAQGLSLNSSRLLVPPAYIRNCIEDNAPQGKATACLYCKSTTAKDKCYILRQPVQQRVQMIRHLPVIPVQDTNFRQSDKYSRPVAR